VGRAAAGAAAGATPGAATAPAALAVVDGRAAMSSTLYSGGRSSTAGVRGTGCCDEAVLSAPAGERAPKGVAPAVPRACEAGTASSGSSPAGVCGGRVKGTCAGEAEARCGDLPMDGKSSEPPEGMREAEGAASSREAGCGVKSIADGGRGSGGSAEAGTSAVERAPMLDARRSGRRLAAWALAHRNASGV
jgi:hypothetical protein